MRIAKTVALLTTLLMVSTVPAPAQDFLGILQGLAGKYVITWSDFDGRKADIETAIAQASLAGKLTPAQQTAFRAELTKINTDATAARADGRRMSITESVTFSNQIAALSANVQQAIGQTVGALPDVDALQLQLGSRIDTQLAAGNMTATAATNFKSELRQIASIEAAYKRDTGALTPRQIEILSESLNKLKVDIDQQVQIGSSAIPVLNDRRLSIETKLNTAVTNGRLSNAEAETLRSDLARIASEQSSYQAAGGGTLTGAQVLRIAQGLDQIDSRVDLRVGGGLGGGNVGGGNYGGGNYGGGNYGGGNYGGGGGGRGSRDITEVDTLHRQLTNRINKLLSSGKLSAVNAAEVTGQLDDIMRRKETIEDSGATRPGQIRRMVNDLDKVSTTIDNFLVVGSTGGNPPGDDPDVGTGAGGTVNTGGGFNVGNLPVVNAKSFNDTRGFWGEQYVTELASRNVIGGFPDGTFKPNDGITRAEFAAIAAKALHLQPVGGASNFNDVPSTHWAAGVIGAASNAGLITGFPDGSFKPAERITRAQALVILSKALRGASANTSALQAYSDRAAVPAWAEPSIAQAANAHIIVSFPDANQIRPNALATRGDVAGLMYQTLAVLGANLPPLKIGVKTSGS